MNALEKYNRAIRQEHKAIAERKIAEMELDFQLRISQISPDKGVKTITHKEAAKLVKRNNSTIIRYLRNGRLPYVNHVPRGDYHIEVEVFEEFAKGMGWEIKT